MPVISTGKIKAMLEKLFYFIGWIRQKLFE
jgi:hypothetical protein